MKRQLLDSPLFEIQQVIPCQIIERINRFVLEVEIAGKCFRAHINNTGRLHEILTRGRAGFFFKTPHTEKTDFRLFAIEEKNSGALIDTQFQMKTFEIAFQKNLIPRLECCCSFRKNTKLGNSLIDYLFACKGNPVYLEVKSPDLEVVIPSL